jgi:hypothetical protein
VRDDHPARIGIGTEPTHERDGFRGTIAVGERGSTPTQGCFYGCQAAVRVR